MNSFWTYHATLTSLSDSLITSCPANCGQNKWNRTMYVPILDQSYFVPVFWVWRVWIERNLPLTDHRQCLSFVRARLNELQHSKDCTDHVASVVGCDELARAIMKMEGRVDPSRAIQYMQG